MIATLLLPLLAVGAPPATPAMAADAPIRITLDHDARYLRGDQVRVRVSTQQDGYLLVLQASPDGYVRVLFPLDPGDDNFVRGDKTYEIRGRGDRRAFTVAASSGSGAVYAALAPVPFNFASYSSNGHWDYGALNQTQLTKDLKGDLTSLVQGMAGARFDYDIVSYSVYDRYADNDGYGAGYAGYAGYNSGYCDWGYYGDCGGGYFGYGGSRFFFGASFGSPFYYDPFFYGYGPYYYDPFYYRPYVYHPTVIYRPGYVYPSYPYSTYYPGGRRYVVSPYQYKQNTRLWGGLPYRTRASTLQATNVIYPSPVRRFAGDAGRAPSMTPAPASRSGVASPSEGRRRVAAPAPVRVQPERARPEGRPAEPRGTYRGRENRVTSFDKNAIRPEAVRVPEERGRKGWPQDVSPRRSMGDQQPGFRPQIERIEQPRVSQPQVRSIEPRPMAEPRIERRQAPPPRMERAPAPERRESPPPRMEAPRYSPPPAARGGEGGGGGRRRM